MNTFKLEITAPSKPIFTGEVNAVILPGEDGTLGILKGHAPILAALKKGKIRVKKSETEKTFEIESGFVEVNENGVTVLIK